MQLALSAPNLGSASSRLQVFTLISYSEVPLPPSPVTSSPSASPQTRRLNTSVAIAVPVIIFVLLLLVSLLSVLGCLVYWKRRHTILPLRLAFRKMGDGDDLAALDAKPENYEFELDEVKSDMGNGSSSCSEDNCYEGSTKVHTGTVV